MKRHQLSNATDKQNNSMSLIREAIVAHHRAYQRPPYQVERIRSRAAASHIFLVLTSTSCWGLSWPCHSIPCTSTDIWMCRRPCRGTEANILSLDLATRQPPSASEIASGKRT